MRTDVSASDSALNVLAQLQDDIGRQFDEHARAGRWAAADAALADLRTVAHAIAELLDAGAQGQGVAAVARAVGSCGCGACGLADSLDAGAQGQGDAAVVRVAARTITRLLTTVDTDTLGAASLYSEACDWVGGADALRPLAALTDRELTDWVMDYLAAATPPWDAPDVWVRVDLPQLRALMAAGAGGAA